MIGLRFVYTKQYSGMNTRVASSAYFVALLPGEGAYFRDSGASNFWRQHAQFLIEGQRESSGWIETLDVGRQQKGGESSASEKQGGQGKVS